MKTPLTPEQVAAIAACPNLCYHHFAPEPWDGNPCITTPEKFERNLAELRDLGYQCITLRHVWQCMRGERPWPDKCCSVSMDDGYESNYTLAFPILQKYNVHSDIFVVTNSMEPEWNAASPDFRHFSWEQAKEMQDSGLVTIHSHGRTHSGVPDMSPEAFRDNVLGSIALIKEHLGNENVAFEFPGGSRTPELMRVVYELGVDMQMTLAWKITPEQAAFGAVPRLSMGYDTVLTELIDDFRNLVMEHLSEK